MSRLKRLSGDGIRAALNKAELYRFLNEPWEAESICRDILAVEPGNQQALVLLIAALTDQFADARSGGGEEATRLLELLEGEYERLYYAGIVNERQARALLRPERDVWGPAAYELLEKAMECYERAEAIRPPANDDALLRWNTCLRMIERYRLHPAPGPPSGEYRAARPEGASKTE